MISPLEVEAEAEAEELADLEEPEEPEESEEQGTVLVTIMVEVIGEVRTV